MRELGEYWWRGGEIMATLTLVGEIGASRPIGLAGKGIVKSVK